MTLLLAFALSLQDVEELIRRLGADAQESRDQAYAALLKQGEGIEAALRAHLRDDDAEVRVRVEGLLLSIEARRFGKPLVAEGVPQEWIDANLPLVGRLKAGRLEDLLAVVRAARGTVEADERETPASLLRGSAAAALMNHILARVKADPTPPDELSRLTAIMIDAAMWIGSEEGGTGDVLNSFDMVGLLELSSTAIEYDSSLFSFLRSWRPPNDVNERVLKSKIVWDLPMHGEWLKLLSRRKSPELLPELIRWGRSESSVQRKMAATLMGEWRTDRDRSAPVLRGMLDDPEESVVAAGLAALLQFSDGRTIEGIGGFLKHPSASVRAAAIDGAVRLRLPGAREAALEGLESGQRPVLEASARAAGALAIEEAGPLLLEAGARGLHVRLLGQTLPLTGWNYSSDQILEWIEAQHPDRLDPGHALQVMRIAMLMSGRPPDARKLAGFLERVGDGWDDHDPLIAAVLPTADAATRDRFDALMRQNLPRDGRQALDVYRRVDPARVRGLIDEMVDSGDPGLVYQALDAARESNIHIAKEIILRLLKGQDDTIAGEAMIHAGDAGVKEVAPDILEVLKGSKSNDNRAWGACRALGRLRHEPALEELIRRVEAGEPWGPSVGRIGLGTYRARIEGWLKSRDAKLVCSALEAFDAAGEIEALERFVQDPRPEVRICAVERWAKSVASPSPELLRAISEDPLPGVRRVIGHAIGKVRDRELLDRMLRDPDPSVRSRVANDVGEAFRNRGTIPREWLEPHLRAGLQGGNAFSGAALAIYPEIGWPADVADSPVWRDTTSYGDYLLRLRLDWGDAGALPEALPMTGTSEGNWILVTANALRDKTGYDRLRGVRVRRDDPDPIASICKAAGLAFAGEKPPLKWRWDDWEQTTARIYFWSLVDDPSIRLAPILSDGTLRFVPVERALPVWRDEHVRRARLGAGR